VGVAQYCGAKLSGSCRPWTCFGCAQALASASCTRSSARSELQAIDLANARGPVSSASNPVRNGCQFWRGTLQRCGSEFDDNSNKRPPVRGVHRGHRGNRRYFRASRPGATRRTASYLQISPSRGSAVCLYRYRLRHSHKRLSPLLGSCHPPKWQPGFAGKRDTEGGAASTPRTRFRPALTMNAWARAWRQDWEKSPSRLRAIDGRRFRG